MKILPVLLLFAFLSGVFAEVPQVRKEEVVKALRADTHLDVRKYSKEEQAWLEEWILTVAKKQPESPDDAWDRQLLQIGHRPTIEHYGKILAAGGSSHHIFGTFQPRLIKYLEAGLSIDEPAWRIQNSDTTLWRDSVSAAAGIVGIISRSAEFDADARLWAGEHKKLINSLGGDDPEARKGLEEARGIVREWWAENKQAVVEERFADVKPGKVHSFILEKQPKPEPLEPAESVVKRPEPRGESSSAPKAAQDVAEAPKESSNWYWAVPAVCVALLVGLVAAFRKKR